MNDATLNSFRDIASAMRSAASDWQWIGQHMSQRMFGITEARAKEYAKTYGGEASQLVTCSECGLTVYHMYNCSLNRNVITAIR